jgi:hypothetical protein
MVDVLLVLLHLLLHWPMQSLALLLLLLLLLPMLLMLSLELLVQTTMRGLVVTV